MKIFKPIEAISLYEVVVEPENEDEAIDFVNWCSEYSIFPNYKSDEYMFWIPKNEDTISLKYQNIPFIIYNEFVKIINVLQKDKEDKGYLLVYIIRQEQ
jgi:hypothetical protein